MGKLKEIRGSRYLAALVLSLLIVGPARAQSVGDRMCAAGVANCFSDHGAGNSAAAEPPVLSHPRMVTMYLRTFHSWPFAHHWVEVDSSEGPVTIGFGPATIPFIDAGQVSVQDSYGNIQRRSWMHLFSIYYHYAEPPGAGHIIGKPIQLSLARSDAIIEKQRHRKFIFPYIPFFHDCRTYTCTLQAAAQGKSSLPCYVLFKGYW